MKTVALSGEENMQKTLQSINNISMFTDDIKNTIEVIENVAEQTSILSLNAAIEAAHSGEAGKGFNIVEEEIRKLSATTKESSNNITSKLSQVISEILNTKKLSEKTNDSIKKSAPVLVILVQVLVKYLTAFMKCLWVLQK